MDLVCSSLMRSGLFCAMAVVRFYRGVADYVLHVASCVSPHMLPLHEVRVVAYARASCEFRDLSYEGDQVAEDCVRWLIVWNDGSRALGGLRTLPGVAGRVKERW